MSDKKLQLQLDQQRISYLRDQIEINEKEIYSRELELKEINRKAQVLKDTMVELSKLVEEQGLDINIIAKNIKNAKNNVTSAHTELIKLEK